MRRATVDEDDNDWLICPADGEITGLHVDHRFSLMLVDGPLIVFESPFLMCAPVRAA